MTPVFRCSDYFEAHLLAGLLREHGIDTFVQGSYLQGALGEVPAIGFLAIMVDEEDRTAAKRIVDAYERGDLKLDDAQFE
ncbi:DUF2007 domain-containing protein [Steroidobacter sp. S1-65]|uniref:DUF2007 domain-containing protein n=1 Tax=Steroidobacter gossypii TaxID=2805490 RepID=A0ABS1WUR0_9GAMM|nr:DUF2007 domain-containing protein [Steroidobacter gossypii]MBM0104712.1 DUF2007 domain-containing protein [Steroidobacter gossypii]